MKQCPQCGTVNADAAQVCASCGVGLQNVAAQPTQAQPTQQMYAQPVQPMQPTQQMPVVGGPPVPPPATGGVHWIVWVLAAALGLAILGIIGLAILFFSYSRSGETASDPEPVATATAQATQTAQPATAQPQPAPAAPQQPAPQQPAPQQPAPSSGVDVTYESGNSPTFITDAFTVNGVNYITVDWVQLRDNPDWGWDVVNENPKLRTFIVPPSAYLAEADPGTAAEYSITWSDLKAASDRGDYVPNNSRIFEMVVSNGEVVSLVEWWHP